MTLSVRALLTIPLLFVAMPSMAQDEARADESVAGLEDLPDDAILVTGQNAPVSVQQVQRQARDIAVRTGDMRVSPLARFEDRLCPGIVGLADEFAGLMIDRLRQNAGELEIRLLDDGCTPNFIVVFTQDGGAMMAQLMQDNPQAFQYLNAGQQAEILEPGPVHVWTQVEARTLTGMPIAQVRNLAAPPQMSVHAAHTRIYTTTRRDIASVMVVFDLDAVRGMTLGQLADYATMRGLAQTREPGDPAMDTILALFDRGAAAAPLGLTTFDRAYLRSLYDGIPNLPGFRRWGGTARQLRLMVEEDEAGQ